MTTITVESISDTPKNAALQVVKTVPEVHGIVTFFYPEQLPQRALLPWHIEDIMNCDLSEAISISNKVESYAGRKIGLIGVFLIDFCAYMEVDEMLVQLFLASIRQANAIPKLKNVRLKDSKVSRNSPMKVAQIIEHLKNNEPDGVEIVKQRAAIWKEMYPYDEPMGKRKDKYRTMIYTDEVAQILEIHLRTAQTMFQTIRDAEGWPRNTRITVKKFCHFYKYDEADIRKALAVMYGEDEPLA